MDTKKLDDQQIVDAIMATEPVKAPIIDEYYRRCIPLYLDFLGIHWHTGFYQSRDIHVAASDQERMIDHLAGLAHLKPADRLLDVGCGIGASCCHFAQHYDTDTVGLTPVYEQQQMALHLAKQRGVSISVDLGHAESLPYADEQFDVVTIFESACHFTSRAAFVAEAWRVLKPGGRMVGEDWMATDLGNQAATSEWLEPICKTWAIPMLGDLREYQTLLIEHDFVDVELVDMQSLMPLQQGFAVTEAQQRELQEEINVCQQPLWKLTLQGLQTLGRAMRAQAFTIGQFSARKPA